jgi:glutathione S-transferase
MKLYYMSFSTYSQKVLIALYEKGLDFEREKVALFDPDVKAAYQKIYPIGKIPLLRTEGLMIPESTIIIEYLEDKYPQGTKLIPDQSDKAGKVRLMDRMSDLYLNNPVVALLFESMKPGSERNNEEIEKAEQQLINAYHYLDYRFDGQRWACGDDFTMADCACIPPLFYAQQVFPFEQYKNLVAYYERALQRESYQRVLEEAVPDLEAFQKTLG